MSHQSVLFLLRGNEEQDLNVLAGAKQAHACAGQNPNSSKATAEAVLKILAGK